MLQQDDIFLHPKLSLFNQSFIYIRNYTESVRIKKIIKEYPKDLVVEKFTFDEDVPENETATVRFFHNKKDLNWIKYDDFERKDNEIVPKLNCTYVHMVNCYVNSAASIATLNGEFPDVEPNKKLKFLRRHSDGLCFLHFDNVIALGHSRIDIYGHWIYDVLSPLTLFPDELIRKSYFLINRGRELVIESLAMFGVDEFHIINIDCNEWAFAKNVYVMRNPLPHVSHFGIAFNRLSKRFNKYYNLDSIKPERYCLGNRVPGRRCILNFDDIVAAIRITYPRIEFTIVSDYQSSLRESALVWAAAKLMFMPTGSNFCKNMFMHHGSVCVIGLADYHDPAMSSACCSHGIYVLFFVIMGMKHHQYQNGYKCDVDLAVRCVGIGINCAQNGNWMKGESFYNCPNPRQCV